MLQSSKLRVQKQIPWIIFLAAIVIGLSTAFSLFAMDKYSLLYFGDATSHSFGARKIVDWVEPGLQQLGTVWLPLPHLLLLPFALVDPLFTTGFAGVAVSLPSFAITSVLIYKMVRRNISTTLMLLPLCAAMLYVANPNIVYLGITAMTEAPFMLFFVAAAFYFQKWLENPSKLSRYLTYSAIFVVLASLCRYEAWILPLFLIPVAAVIAARNKDVKSRRVLVVLSSLISISGILFWLGYNAILYGDALEFANADYYSAASQAANRSIRETLFLKPAAVLSVYSGTALAVYGPILVSAGAGYAIWLKERRARAKMVTSHKANNDQDVRSDATKSPPLLYIFVALPPLFTLVTLFVGIGEMTFWFNSRFLILMAPLLMLLSSIFIDRIWRKYGSFYSRDEDQATKPVSSMIPSLVVASFFIYYLAISVFGGVATYLDAKAGFDFHPNPYSVQTGEALKSIYDGEGKIMMLTGSAQEHRIMVFSGIPLVQFDEIIESNTSKESYQEPWKYARWIVISKSPDSDGVTSTRYWAEERRAELDAHYAKVYENAFYEVLVLKTDQ